MSEEAEGSEKCGRRDESQKSRSQDAESGRNPDPQQEEIRKLRLQVTQLKNIIKKLTGQDVNPEGSDGDGGGGGRSGKRKKGPNRAFDFGLYAKRHVVFRVAYFGWDYHGFAVQETSGKTIESELFKALITTRLIESRESSNYHRCGRTDKGVSASHQVISIDVRSNLIEGQGVFLPNDCKAQERRSPGFELEIDYCKMLNSNLPDHIQVIAWAPCPSREFSARFDCRSRTYKYFFPLADLDLNLINEAGQKLCGSHDFRNFCKLDVANGVTNYIRFIEEVRAETLSRNGATATCTTMCSLTVKGKAFLWHQIRCIVTVLFLVGQGKESPVVIDQLLNIDQNPCRPQYGMASEVPLNLFSCDYEDADLKWKFDEDSIDFVFKQFQKLWAEHQVKAVMLSSTLEVLAKESNHSANYLLDGLMPRNKVKHYVPLLSLMKCPSLEEKLGKRQKLTHSDIDS